VNSLPALIGLAGKAHAGKDTAAEHLAKVYGYKRLYFGRRIDEYACRFFDIPEKEKSVLSRRIKQGIGEMFRSVENEYYWIKFISSEYARMKGDDGESRVVVSDVRRLNEIDWIRSNGGQVWLLERADCPPVEYGAGHQSETEIESFTDWDLILDPSEGAENVWAEVDRVLAFHKAVRHGV